MPNISKPERVIERIQTHTQTQKGEVTINLNLKITIDGGDIKLQASAAPELNQQKKIKEEKKLINVPEEQFDLEIPVLNNFGKKTL